MPANPAIISGYFPLPHQEIPEVCDNSLYSSSHSFYVCNANPAHIEDAKSLADENRHIFGFITRGAFYDAWQEGSLIVAIKDDKVVGFLRYHHRKRDLQTTLYDICVTESERGKGLGRSMIALLVDACRSIKREVILLKCPSHLAANIFYERNGFTCIGTIEGKHQKLNVWQLDLTSRGQ